MTLSFSTTYPPNMDSKSRQPNHFIAKIWHGLTTLGYSNVTDYLHYKNKALFDRVSGWTLAKPVHAKIHTLREDIQNRWGPNMLIHFVIHNRTAQRFQFAPVTPCTHIQAVRINYTESPFAKPYIEIDGYTYSPRMAEYKPLLEDLSRNDGFDSPEDFLSYFNKDWTGKIIHWTTKKY